MTARMHPLSLYLDTSVIGGYFDPEFMADTRALWRLRHQGHIRSFASVVTEQEIQYAPQRVRDLMRSTFGEGTLLPMSTETDRLASGKLVRKVVPVDYEDDALHVATCTVAHIPYLESWNFKHLANVHRENGFNAVNILQGYRPVRIVAPAFLIHGHGKEEL